jgi:phospholipase/carboxylesterase
MNRLAAPLSPHATSFSSKFDGLGGGPAPPCLTSGARGPQTPPRIGPTAPGVALFQPIHYERRYAYPLVVWLHDDGGSEQELRRVMPLVSVRNFVGAACRGEAASGASSDCMWRQTPAATAAAADRVRRCVDQAKEHFNVHPQRVFLAGAGAGGTMALRLALQVALPVAGVISVNGSLPRGNCLLARVNDARRVPILLITCSDSQRYAAPQVADDLRLLHAGGFSLALRHYLCGDELYSDMFADMNEWLMERVCGAPSAAPA